MPGPLKEDQLYRHARHAAFYDLELRDFEADLSFYRHYLPPPPSRILELGCGTGRVTRSLARDGHRLVGVDLSPAMLAAAMAKPAIAPAPRYACMDISRPGLRGRFDAAIIPYNTLNLLTAPRAIDHCLAGIHALLADGALLLAQVYIPDQDLLAQGTTRRFQFRIFDCPDGAKLIKESLKGYDAASQMVEITDRYRLRFQPGRPDEDWQYDYRVVGRPAQWWLDRLINHGFLPMASHGDYDLSPVAPGQHTMLLLAATAAR
ncbi:MAG: class I SAM-dependent methyltransferase [Thermodesulfobacteriota bacterium]